MHLRLPALLSTLAWIAIATETASATAGPLFNATHLPFHFEKRTTALKPVMNGVNFPDPSLIRLYEDYYAFATNAKVNGKAVHIQVARSMGSFEAWSFLSGQDALPTLPNWVDASNPRVWAPDVIQLANGKFVMYFTAASKTNTAIHCLGVATASTVLGPYTPTDMTSPWACPYTAGGAIDPAGYYDPSTNTRWVVYKVDGNSIGHGGICNNGVKPIVSTPIVLQQVNVADGHSKIGSVSSPLIVNGAADGPVVEAPSLTRMSDGTYVLFFSSNCYATPLYDVSYATAKNIKGPYTKYGPMFVTGTDGLTAPGGLDLAINGVRAVFHADYNGGRAMFTALVGGSGNKYTAYVKPS